MKLSKQKVICIVLGAAVLALVGWYLWYTLPEPFEDVCRGAGWNAFSSETTTLTGDYHFYEENDEAGGAPVHFVVSMEEISAGDSDFTEILAVLQQLQFHKTLSPSKTRTHATQPGDAAIYLSFQSPDCGPLRVTFWFDELYMTFDGEEFVAPKGFDAVAEWVAEFILERGGEKEQFE